MAMKRIGRKTTNEMLWPYVLRLLKDKPMYAYELRQAMSKKFGFKPPSVTCYHVLNRLQREGCTAAEWEDQHGKPARKYYRITPAGTKLLESAQKYFEELSTKLSG